MVGFGFDGGLEAGFGVGFGVRAMHDTSLLNFDESNSYVIAQSGRRGENFGFNCNVDCSSRFSAPIR